MKGFAAMASMVIGLGFLCAGDDPKDKVVKDEIKKLQGKWQAVFGKENGMELPGGEVRKVHMIIDGEQYTDTVLDKVAGKGTFKILLGTDIKRIEFTSTEGEDKGKTMYGIYEIDGDSLKTCFTKPGKEYPKEFTAEKGSNQVLNVYKRR